MVKKYVGPGAITTPVLGASDELLPCLDQARMGRLWEHPHQWNYILSRPHSSTISEQLGDLWEVILPEDAEVEGVQIGRGVWDFRVNQSTWQGSQLFRAKGKRHVMATEEAKSWLEDRAEGWLQFQEAQIF